MQVTEAVTFNGYWVDPRFRRKRPNLGGSLKHAFGDNIYLKDDNKKWLQLDSHHSYKGGVPNPYNIQNDTQADRVLIGTEYAYWGRVGPRIDERFRDYHGHDVCARRYHKSNFPPSLVGDFVTWFHSLNAHGYLGDPLDWPKIP